MGDVLAPFLSATSVAVIGASDDPSRIGGRPLRYLRDAGYPGRVFPVNPRRTLVQGLPSVADVRDLAEIPELAIVAVARDSVPGVLRSCAEHGITSAIVFAAGFAEAGDPGRQAQDEVTAIARDSGMRILGPNCNGCIHPVARAAFAFTPVLADGMPKPGRVAVASQSAAIGTYWLRRMRERQIGLHSLVHTGNEADLGLPETLLSLLPRDDVSAVLVGLEQWRDPATIRAVADAMQSSSTRVVVLPLGTTARGRAAAASHTGNLVERSSHLVLGLLREAGAVVVDDLEEALLIASTIVPGREGSGRRVAVVTPSGGFGVLLADAFSNAGFDLPEMPESLQRAWHEAVPFASTRNPVDVTAQLVNEPGLYDRFVRDVIGTDRVDHLVVFLPHASREDGLTTAVARAAEASHGTVSLSVVGSISHEIEAWLRDLGIHVFATPRQAAEVLRHLLVAGVRPRNPSPDTPTPSGPIPDRPDGLSSDEIESKRVVAAWGVPVVAEAIVASVDEAAAAADRFGYPVVMKRIEVGVAHKAARGSVRMGLENPTAVSAAAEELMRAARAETRFVVQPQLTGDELLLSVIKDPAWGSVALFGLGGADVENREDVHVRSAPPSVEAIESMIGESPMLTAMFRGHRARSIPTISRILEALANLVDHAGARTVELNPVILDPAGSCVAVDALIEWAELVDGVIERSHARG